MNSPDAEQSYNVAKRSVGMFQYNIGALDVRGKDALDFLHRMSTNDLLSLQPGQTCVTVLTNDKAKIIDLVRVIVKKDSLLLLTSEDQALNVIQWLGKFIIMEDVQLSDITSTISICSLIGPKVFSLIQEHVPVGIPTVSTTDFFEKNDLMLFRNDIWTQPVYSIISTNDSGANFFQTAIKMSMNQPECMQILSNEVWNTLRVEEGVPLHGFELTDQINPLEAGLEQFISFTKGCYIGQEVIARIDTYKKLQKKLTGFMIDGNDQEQLLEPGKILFEGSEVGWTTSHCWSFRLNKIIALGYLKTNVTVNEVEFQPHSSSKLIKATISSLPFQ